MSIITDTHRSRHELKVALETSEIMLVEFVMTANAENVRHFHVLSLNLTFTIINDKGR